RAQLREMGRAAGLARGGAGGAAARRLDGAHGADGAGLCQPGRGVAGGAAGAAVAAAGDVTLRAWNELRGAGGAGGRGCVDAAWRRAEADPDGPGDARSHRLVAP